MAAAVAVLLLALAAAWVARPAAHRSQPASQQAASRIKDQFTTPSIDWNSPVRLHGPVKKHGPLAMLSLLGAGAERTQLVFPKARQGAGIYCLFCCLAAVVQLGIVRPCLPACLLSGVQPPATPSPSMQEWQQQRLAGRRPKPPPLCTVRRARQGWGPTGPV